VAMVEAGKGALVLLSGFGVLTLLHFKLGLVAASLVGHLHLNPAKKYPSIFVDALSGVSDGRLWFLASLALVYSIMRFVEAYGLWRRRIWAGWFALISAGIYLPIEVFSLIRRVTWIRIGATVVNLLIVAFMIVVLLRSRKGHVRES
jgi:uncharacterized membrane protein (DUF2068 family)